MANTINNNLKMGIVWMLISEGKNAEYIRKVIAIADSDHYDRYGDDPEMFETFPEALIPNMDLGKCQFDGSTYTYGLKNGETIVIRFPEIVEEYKRLNGNSEVTPTDRNEIMGRMRHAAQMRGMTVEEYLCTADGAEDLRLANIERDHHEMYCTRLAGHSRGYQAYCVR